MEEKIDNPDFRIFSVTNPPVFVAMTDAAKAKMTLPEGVTAFIPLGNPFEFLEAMAPLTMNQAPEGTELPSLVCLAVVEKIVLQ